MKFRHVIIITTNIAINENAKFTNPERIFANGNKYLGIYTFFIKDAFDIMAYIAVVVASELKENNNDPAK